MTREKSINMAGHRCESMEKVIVLNIFIVLWTQELLSLANFRSKFFSCCKGLYSIFGSTSSKQLKRMKFCNFNLALSLGPVLSSPGPCSAKRPNTVLNTNLNSNRNTETRPHHEAAELLRVSLTNLPSLGWACLAPPAGSVDTITAAAKMLQTKVKTQIKMLFVWIELAVDNSNAKWLDGRSPLKKPIKSNVCVEGLEHFS